MRILCVCRDNSVMSQMAELWLKYYTKGKAEVYSVGLEKGACDSYAQKALSEAVLDAASYKIKTLEDINVKKIDVVITFNENVEQLNISFSKKINLDINKPDISNCKDEIAIQDQYRIICNEIEDQCFDICLNKLNLINF